MATLDWIIIDFHKQKMVCKRCKQEENTPWQEEPCGMMYGLGCMEAFRKVHKKCKERKQ